MIFIVLEEFLRLRPKFPVRSQAVGIRYVALSDLFHDLYPLRPHSRRQSAIPDAPIFAASSPAFLRSH
jgi:hypothetical protein